MVVALSFAVALVSWLMTAAVRRYALARRVLDQPNERSSHTVPTPRGGGLAIVIAFCAGLLFLVSNGQVQPRGAWAVLGAGAWVAVVGFIDDHRHIAARWRLLAHFVAAGWALAWLGGLPVLRLAGATLDLGVAGSALAAVFLVWLLNLYNFMDGIDGIAGVEAITVALPGAALWWLATGSADAVVPVLVAAAALGFLPWNFPPARIFMGDAGSGFLGVVLGTLAVWSAHQQPQLFWSWVILLGAFIVDATVTLLRRLYRRERVYEAHRSHAYQYASRVHGEHRVVTLAVGAINLLWLAPLAALVALGQIDGLVGLALAYAPLIALAYRYKAGAREHQA
ncbi:MAG: MraY family glycosyltransferase [Burkholderiaceae bacterium]